MPILEISMTEQGIVFLFSCAVGFSLGCFYDVFRIFRIAFNPKWLVVFFQDIFFCVVSALVIILSIYYTNSGRVRIFGLAGCFLFFVLYYLTVGRFMMFLSKKIIDFIKRMLNFLYSITIKPMKSLILFIVAIAKKQAGYIAEIYLRIKNSLVYASELRNMSRTAGRGFDLYSDSKTRISKGNMKLIKNTGLRNAKPESKPEEENSKKFGRRNMKSIRRKRKLATQQKRQTQRRKNNVAKSKIDGKAGNK